MTLSDQDQASRGAERRKPLTPQMLAVLQSIARPHPDDEPFPPRATVKALMARGLVRCVSAREEARSLASSSHDIIMAALGSQRLIVTPAGLKALPPAPPTRNPAEEKKDQP
ncbi:hypothetical protein [Methylobacterium fujisawaense]|uniref:hypothetical protein n=1 Tax=Methylobacterium fujisawaense TaxID=107400 RepID=UPI00313C8EB7